jgi:DNA-binding NarL/FixJ family response regulator
LNAVRSREIPQQGGRARVVIADDYPLVREGLLELLEAEPAIEVVGCAESAIQVQDLVRTTDPQMIVLDLSLGADDGAELARRLLRERPKLKIVVLTMHDELLLADRLLEMGVMAYVTKNRACDELLLAVRTVLRGEIYVTAEQRERLATRVKVRKSSTPETLLSSRELEILRLLASGNSSAAIAAALSISIKTVHSHRRNIGAKLGIRRARELLRYAVVWLCGFQGDPTGGDRHYG